MSPSRLDELLQCFSRARVAVLGDFFLDKYYDVDSALAETSLETGKVAHQVVRVRHSAGSAGTVVNNLAALKPGKLYAVGYIGDDGDGMELARDLPRGVTVAVIFPDRGDRYLSSEVFRSVCALCPTVWRPSSRARPPVWSTRPRR